MRGLNPRCKSPSSVRAGDRTACDHRGTAAPGSCLWVNDPAPAHVQPSLQSCFPDSSLGQHCQDSKCAFPWARPPFPPDMPRMTCTFPSPQLRHPEQPGLPPIHPRGSATPAPLPMNTTANHPNKTTLLHGNFCVERLHCRKPMQCRNIAVSLFSNPKEDTQVKHVLHQSVGNWEFWPVRNRLPDLQRHFLR